MDALRPRRSPDSDRFLGLFSPPTASSPAAAGGIAVAGGGTGDAELDEDDVFWPGADDSDSDSGNSMSIPIPIPNPSPSFAHSPFRNRHFGILAALPEDDPAPLLQRKPSLTASSASASTSPSSSSSARMIPKPKPADYPHPHSRSMSITRGYHHHQSAPVNVPAPPPRPRRDWGELDLGGAGEEGEEEMLPPHEIVARASAKESPMTTFSVLEGVGRTLKGRDLRRVRNAVWRKTGFLD